jgi:hypothetical protein
VTETARLVLAVDSSSAKRATGDLRDLAKQGRATEGALGNLKGKLAGIAIGTGVVAGLTAIVRATIESEKAQAQLAAVLKSTKGAAGLTADELNRMAAALQGVSTYDDEAITGAQSLLLTFTNIGASVFPEATQAVLDMSTALGQDLSASAVQLGKALQDPIEGITALRRVGVNFSDAQKEVIQQLVETGRQADAQRLILKELETEFGGSAEAARNTLGGALQGLENDFQNLLEGDSGGDGIRGATSAVNDLGATMRSDSVRAGFAAMIQGLAHVASFAANAIGAVVGLGNAISQQFASADKRDYNGLLARRAALSDRQTALESKGMGVGRSLQTLSRIGLGPTLDQVKAEIADIDKRLAAARSLSQSAGAGPAADGFALDGNITIRGGGSEDWKTARGGGGGARDHSAEDAKRAAEEAAHANEDFRRTLQDLRDELAGPLAQAETEHNRKLAELKQLAKDGKVSSEELQQAITAEAALYQREVDAINSQKTPTQELIEQKQFELSLLQMTNAERQTAIDLRNLEGKATTEQASQIRDLNDTYDREHKAIGVMDDLRQSFTGAFASVLDGSKSAKQALREFADSVVQMIARIIAEQAAAKIFGAAGTGAGGATGGLLSSILGGLFGGGGGGSAPGFASGTSFAPGGMAWVGERGPELVNLPRGSQVIPNHRAARGQTVINNISVAAGTSRETAQQLATKVAGAVRLAQRSA